MIYEKMDMSLLDMKIPPQVFLFVRTIQKEFITSVIKWMVFICENESDFSFPDINDFIS